MEDSRISLQDVRESLNPNVKAHYTVRWFGRPIANRITPAFFNSGWSADGASYFRAWISLLGLILLTTPTYWGAIAAGAIAFMSLIFDCLDGNLARLRGTVTYWGKFLDGLIDYIFIMGMPLATGLALLLAGESFWWLFAGSITTIATLVSQMTRARLSFMREWMTNQSGPIDDQALKTVARWRSIQSWAAVVYVNGTCIAPLALFIPDFGRLILIVFLIPVQLIPEIVWTVATIAEARTILYRVRRSIHSPIVPGSSQSKIS